MKPFQSNQDAPRRFIRYWAPMLAWMTAIFALSSLTSATIEQASPPVGALRLSEVAHAVEFGVLAVLAYRLFVSYRAPAGPFLWVAVLLFTMGYAVTDELHQSLVPDRDPSWIDLGFDFLGGMVGLLAAETVVRVRRRPN